MMDTCEDPVEESGEPNGSEFLDSFYGITSSNPVERAKAGRILLFHAVLGPEANPKDAAYAFRRLMSGLCSGRASARQGNSAVLASFLKLQHDLSSVRKELSSEPEEAAMSDLQFVRHRLCKTTELDPNGLLGRGGGRKGSEERDHQFGRLFGINSIVRSGILSSSQEEETILQLAQDLVDLYHQKNWLREPSTHAICLMLQSFEGSAIVGTIVSQVIFPNLLSRGDVEHRDGVLACYSAEQIALTLYIQSRCPSQTPLPGPLNVPILSKSSLPHIALALSETSIVVQPRIHLVWDVIWLYITSDPNQRQPRKVQIRSLKPECDGTSTESLLQSLLKHVVYERLLGLEESTGQTKTTHERRALAMSIVRSMAGIEFVSALQGRTRLQLEPTILCNLVFSPIMVQKIFLEVICAGSGRQKNAHMLKPMALQILSELVDALTSSNDDDVSRAQFAIAQALLTSDPRFDHRTKTNTVENLLKPGNVGNVSAKILWKEHINFLQSQVTTPQDSEQSLHELQVSRALGFLENLFHLAKLFSRLLCNENEMHGSAQAFFDEIISYFMGIAFFDCSKVESPTKGQKGGKTMSALREVVSNINIGSSGKALPIEIRTMASARFFSLVTDRVTAENNLGKYQEEPILAFLQSVWALHENFIHLGATSLGDTDVDEEDEEGRGTADTLAEISLLGVDANSESVESRWSCSCKIVAHVLRLLLLSCGSSSAGPTVVGDLEADDEADDHDEISELLLDVPRLMNLFSGKASSSVDDDPMVLLTMVCCTCLTSAFGSGNRSRGASPTLLRESVKLLWVNGLWLAASKNMVLDEACISLLLDAIGAVCNGEEMDVDGQEGEEESDDGQSDDYESPSIKEDDNNFMELDRFDDEQEEEDIELDQSRLQSMLEEDSDVDVDESLLEHHEGADAALAKLIQTKQEARKAGQVARERSILAQQTRIITLFECLFVGKPETWGRLLNFTIVLRIANALLHYRNNLVKSLDRSPRGIVGEKRSFAGRLSVLLKTKILKTRIDSLSMDDYADSFSPIKDEVLKCIRNADNKEQRQLCFQVLLFALKNLANENRSEAASDVFGSLVNDWTTNRYSKIDGTDFEPFIHQSPVLAQTALSHPLAKAGSIARSSFLKVESFRLLGMLYNPKLNANETPFEKDALRCMNSTTTTFLEAFRTNLETDPDMKRAKRIREVLRVVEKCISFLVHYETAGDYKTLLDAVASILQLLEPESQVVTDAVKRICEQIETVVATVVADKGEEASTSNKVRKSANKKKKKKKSKK